jgi:hypothetical protein
MTPATLRPLGDTPPHARWLHELRTVVSTASVAAAMGRRLLRDDAGSAEDVLAEAERALSQCRDLLATAAEHVRPDGSIDAPPRATLCRYGIGAHDGRRGDDSRSRVVG